MEVQTLSMDWLHARYQKVSSRSASSLPCMTVECDPQILMQQRHLLYVQPADGRARTLASHA